jgi:hypothetical protein
MNEIFWLKKFFPVWKANKLLCIGIPDSGTYVEVDYSDFSYDLIKNLVDKGVNLIEIKSSKILQGLYDKNMLTSSLITSRENLYFDFIGLNIENNKLIFSKKILIFGAGAGGSSLAYLLAQIGFKEIIIVDNDIVELSDSKKSFVFDTSDIGKYKVEIIKRRLEETFHIKCNFLIQQANTLKEIEDIIKTFQPSFIVKACDPNLKFRLYLNEACFNNNIPFIHMAYSFDTIKVGPLFVPNATCCDYSTNQSLIEVHGKNHDFNYHEKLFNSYTTHPSISFNVNLLSNFVLKEMVLYLFDRKDLCKSLGRTIVFNPISMVGVSYPLKCFKTCKFVKKLPS